MQLKSLNTNHQNGTLNMPIDGEVEIVNGLVEVSDELGHLLLGNPTDWAATVEEVEELDEEDDTAEKTEDGLDELDLPELIDMAKTAKLKGYNLFAKDAPKMRAFLRKKMKDAAKAADEGGQK